jgi:hypothetical protein
VREPNAFKAAGLAATVVLLVCASAAVPAQDLKFAISDVREAFDTPIPTRRALGSPPVVREPQQLFAPDLAPAPPDPSLGRPIARLGLDSEGLLNVGFIPAGEPLVPGSPLVEFEMGNLEFTMALIEPTLDVDFDAMHYTLVAPGTRNYARFTVSRSGPEIIGTVLLDGDEYRILPTGDRRQIVYPVRLYAGEFRRSRAPDLDTRAGLLEARHLQIAWYADRQPPIFMTRETGILHSYVGGARGRGPKIGQIDVNRAMRVANDGTATADPAAIAEAVELFLNGISHLTLINDPIRVAVTEARLESFYSGVTDLGRVLVRQLIDGSPVASDLRIEFDRGGNVYALSGVLLRDQMAERPVSAPLDEDEAIAIALTAAAEEYGVDWEVTAEAVLVYDFESVVSSARLVWDVELHSKSICFLAYAVQLRADTGEVVRNIEQLRIRSVGDFRRENLIPACRGQR